MRFLTLAMLTLVGSSVFAQDWGQWRGPTRDGMIPAAVVPKQWPAGVTRGWSVEIGEGY